MTEVIAASPSGEDEMEGTCLRDERPSGDGAPSMEDVSVVDRLSDGPVAPGTLLDGRYVVEGVLAEGGMGVVCDARHSELGHRVAIKFLRADASSRPSMVQRFLNEARSAASLRSEHVVRVLDVGQLPSGRPYFVMEHLDGIDLAQLLESDGPVSVEEALDYVLQICAALAEAHAHGIVHRDIKLENVFLANRESSPIVKVIDFGLAKRVDGYADMGLTGPRESLGSPFYMSPEQIMATKLVDARTDIWSLGVVLYHLLTGATPFDGGCVTEVYARVLNAVPVPMHERVPTVDAELEWIVGKCLEKDADRRFQSVVEVTNALDEYRDRRARGKIRSFLPLEDDSPISLPGVHSRLPYAIALSLGLLCAAAYGADRTGEVDVRGCIDRFAERVRRDVGMAIEPVLGDPRVRRITKHFPFGPAVAPMPDVAIRRGPVIPDAAGPPRGVCALDPAFDSSGRTVRAEPERRASFRRP